MMHTKSHILEAGFPVIKYKSECRENGKQAAIEGDCCEGLPGHLKDRNAQLGDVHGLWLLDLGCQ